MPEIGREYARRLHSWRRSALRLGRVAVDLDVAGERSLFARLCTARTRPGAETLARWLLTPAEHATIRERHRAVEELRGTVELREALALSGADGVSEIDVGAVDAWIAGPPALPLAARWPLTLVAAAVVLPSSQQRGWGTRSCPRSAASGTTCRSAAAARASSCSPARTWRGSRR